MTTSDQLLSVFEQFCSEYKINFQQSGEGNFTNYVRGEFGRLKVKCFIRDSSLHFYSILPIIVPPEKYQVVMEFLTLANFGLSDGNFEMDLESGDVAFKTGITLLGGQLTTQTIFVLYLVNIFNADRYLKGLCRVIFANMQPSTALYELEKSEEEEAEDDEDLRELLDDLDLDQVLGGGDD